MTVLLSPAISISRRPVGPRAGTPVSALFVERESAPTSDSCRTSQELIYGFRET